MTDEIRQDITACTFFRSYYEAGNNLGATRRLEFFGAILDYMFKGKVVNRESPFWGMFELARPNIDRSVTNSCNRKTKHGTKHGTNCETNDGTKPATPTKDKEKDKEKEECVPGGTTLVPDFDRVKAWAETHFCPVPPDEFLREWHNRMCEGGWIDKRGGDLTVRGRWQRELSAWWNVEKKNSAPRAVGVAATPAAGAVRNAQGVAIDLAQPTRPEDNEI